MERLTEWNDEQTRHAYYPRCFEGPCYGGGCKINDCPFETAVCDRLAAYEDTGLSPEKVSWMKEVIEAAFDNDTSRIERAHNLHVADKEGRVVVLPCKVGDMVWVIAHPWTGKLQKKPLVAYVNGMKLFTHGLYVNVLFDTLKINGTRDYEIIRIGKDVFLTSEEAEKELAKMEGMKE